MAAPWYEWEVISTIPRYRVKSSYTSLRRFLCFCLSLMFTSNYAQTIQLYLVDDVDCEPIQDAFIEYGDSIAYSDRYGFVQLRQQGLVKTSQTVFIAAEGYEHRSFRIDKEKNNTYEIRLHPSIYRFDDVVIAVNRLEDSLVRPQQFAEQLSLARISFEAAATSADLLQRTGSIHVQKSQPGGGSPNIRGFEANRILLVIDGVRMNNAIYRGGHLQNIITLDEAQLQSVEVLHGPGSLLYGSDAFGGVIHLQTRAPQLSTVDRVYVHGGALIRYGSSNNEKKTNIHFNIGGKRFASQTHLSLTDFGNWTIGRNMPESYGNWGLTLTRSETTEEGDTLIPNSDPYQIIGSGYQQIDAAQDFLFQINPRTSLRWSNQFSTSTSIARTDKLSLRNNLGNPQYAQWDYGPQRRYMSYIKLNTKHPSNRHRGQILLSAQQVEESRIVRRFQVNAQANQIEKVNIYALNADWQSRISDLHKVLYGIESSINFVNSNSSVTNLNTNDVFLAPTRYADGGSILWNLAAYLKHQWQLSTTMDISYGLRYTYQQVDMRFRNPQIDEIDLSRIQNGAGALSFSIATSYGQENGHWKGFTSLSSGFRSPNVDDGGKIFDPTPTELVLPSDNLNPEYIYQVEQGVTWTYGKPFTLKIAVFGSLIDDIIQRRSVTYQGYDSLTYDGELLNVLSNTNAELAYLIGFQGNVSGTLPWGLHYQTSWNYNRGRVLDKEVPLDHIPPFFGRLSLDWNRDIITLSQWVDYAFDKDSSQYSPLSVDNLDEALPFGTPGYVIWNAKAEIRPLEYLHLSLGCLNILDKGYRPFGSSVHAAGRSWTVSLRTTF